MQKIIFYYWTNLKNTESAQLSDTSKHTHTHIDTQTHTHSYTHRHLLGAQKVDNAGPEAVVERDVLALCAKLGLALAV